MQQYDIRKRLLIIIGVSLSLLGILFLALYLLRPRVGASVEDTSAPTQQEVQESLPVTTPTARPTSQTVTAPVVSAPPVEDAGEIYAVQLASIFAERFLSYSNQNDNSHIDLAVSMATDRAARWIRTQGQTYSAVYEGVSTKVITTDLSAYDGDTATVQISLRRTYTGAREGSEFRTARVELIKTGPDWQIDGFYLDPPEEA